MNKYRCHRPTRTGRDCGVCGCCREAIAVVVSFCGKEDHWQPSGPRAPRLAKLMGISVQEATLRLSAYYMRRLRHDPDEDAGPPGCVRCGLRGEHVCLEAPSSQGSSAAALLGAV